MVQSEKLLLSQHVRLAFHKKHDVSEALDVSIGEVTCCYCSSGAHAASAWSVRHLSNALAMLFTKDTEMISGITVLTVHTE